jgi:hypothetical protein
MCFSLGWVEHLLVWLVVICAVVAIVQLLLPLIITPLGGVVAQIIKIVLWAVVAIAVIYVCFDLISCVGAFPRLG